MATKANIASNLADRHEKLAAAARQLAQILESFPELGDELRAELSGPIEQKPPNGHPEPAPRRRMRLLDPDDFRVTNMNRLMRLFLTNGNKLVATPDIGEQTNMDKLTVANVLWSPRAKKFFEQHAHPKNKKTKMWRLKEEVWAAASKGDASERTE